MSRHISAEELAGQLRDSLALYAAPADRQAAFLVSDPVIRRLPPDDLLGQLEDAVLWLPRLLTEQVIDRTVADAVRQLRDFVHGLPNSLWRDEDDVFADPAWTPVRERAADVLAAFDACLAQYRTSRHEG